MFLCKKSFWKDLFLQKHVCRFQHLWIRKKQNFIIMARSLSCLSLLVVFETCFAKIIQCIIRLYQVRQYAFDNSKSVIVKYVKSIIASFTIFEDSSKYVILYTKLYLTTSAHDLWKQTFNLKTTFAKWCARYIKTWFITKNNV